MSKISNPEALAKIATQPRPATIADRIAAAKNADHVPNWTAKTCSCGKEYKLVQGLAKHLQSVGVAW